MLLVKLCYLSALAVSLFYLTLLIYELTEQLPNSYYNNIGEQSVIRPRESLGISYYSRGFPLRSKSSSRGTFTT